MAGGNDAEDFDTSESMLLAAMEIFESLDEPHWHYSANLQHRAQAARQQGKLDDAIDLFTRSLKEGRKIGTMRILQMSSTGSGDAIGIKVKERARVHDQVLVVIPD